MRLFQEPYVLKIKNQGYERNASESCHNQPESSETRRRQFADVKM